MGSTTDKIKGHTNEAVGNVKQAVGKAIGSEKLEVEGGVQELKGEGQVAVGKAKAATKEGAPRSSPTKPTTRSDVMANSNRELAPGRLTASGANSCVLRKTLLRGLGFAGPQVDGCDLGRRKLPNRGHRGLGRLAGGLTGHLDGLIS
jgi:uncharacterized protein YjbJ (UPF0337 family)